MPRQIRETLDLNRIPVVNFVPEKAASAPSTPIDGQIYYNTATNRFMGRENGTFVALDQVGTLLATDRGATNGVASLVSGLVPIAQIPTGTSGTTVPFGNDARFTDTRTPTDGSVTGGAAGAGVKIAAATITFDNIVDGTLTLAKFNASASGAAAGTPSLRAIGATGTTVVAGNDSRLTDTRTPTDASVTGGPAGSGVKIAANTITFDNIAAALKDAADTTTSLRMLGYTATKAMPGVARLDQIAPPTAAVAMNGQKITGGAAATVSTDFVILSQLDAAAAGIDNKPSARIVLTANDTLNGLAARDGITPVAGDRVLATAQSTASQNGIWVAAAGAWTRATDAITSAAFWLVEEGTIGGGSQWKVATANPITVGTTSLTINQWGAAGTTYTGTTNRITVTSGAIDISASYVGQTSITTLGTVTTGTWTATSIAVANGGTGATAAPAARTNLGAPGKYVSPTYTTAIVAGTPFGFTHNLNTQDVTVSVRNTVTNEQEDFLVIAGAVNSITLTSDVAIASPSYVVTVIG